MLQLTCDYMDDLMIRMAHHSTAIEGNSLTQGETKSILLDGYLPRAMDMREMYEVLNYKNLIPFIEESIKNAVEISPILCQKLHCIICTNAIEGNPGEFKKICNYVVGADWEPSPPYRVLEDLKNWSMDLQYQIRASKSTEEIVTAICRQHIRFERIHPFSDGNGRVGRALVVYSCLENNIVPIVFSVQQKKRYISLLGNSDELGLADFAMELQKEELQRIIKINSGKKTELFVSLPMEKYR